MPVSRTRRRPPARASRAGRPARSARRDVQLLPLKNLGGVGDGGAITTRRRQIAERVADAALPRLSDKSRTRTSATTRAWTSCRRRCCASSCRTSIAGPTGAGRRRALTRTTGLGELVRCPSRSGGREPAWHLYVVRTGARRRVEAALRGRARSTRRTTACRCTGSPRWRLRAGGSCRAPRRSPRPPRDPDERGAQPEQAADVTEGVRSCFRTLA